jgi:hypothetical protein
MSRIVRALWLLYAIFFLWLTRGALVDDLNLRYPTYFIVPEVLTYICVALCTIAYALDFRPPWLRRTSRYILSLFVIFLIVGFLMDALLPQDYSLWSAGVAWLLNSALVLVLVVPAALATWSMARVGS